MQHDFTICWYLIEILQLHVSASKNSYNLVCLIKKIILICVTIYLITWQARRVSKFSLILILAVRSDKKVQGKKLVWGIGDV